MKNQEVLEFFEDGIDDFSQLNKQDNTLSDEKLGEDINVVSSTSGFNEIFKGISQTTQTNYSSVCFENEYKSRETDPCSRLLSLKTELNDCIKEIDDFVDVFKTNNFILAKENLPKVYEDIKLYKTKIDSFIDYNIFNNKESTDRSHSNEINDSQSSANPKQLTSLNEHNDILTKGLIAKLKIIEDEFTNNNNKNNLESVQYQILASPENEIQTLGCRLNSLDTEISNLERSIGDWSLVSLYLCN